MLSQMRIVGIDYEADGVQTVTFHQPQSVDGFDLAICDISKMTTAADDAWRWRRIDFEKYLAKPNARLAVFGWHPDVAADYRLSLPGTSVRYSRATISVLVGLGIVSGTDLIVEGVEFTSEGAELASLHSLSWRSVAEIEGEFDVELMRMPNTDRSLGVAHRLPSGAIVFLLPGLAEVHRLEPTNPEVRNDLRKERAAVHRGDLSALYRFLRGAEIQLSADVTPEWADELRLVGEENLVTEALEIERQLEEFDEKRRLVAAARDELGLWKELVFAAGDQLDAAVKRALVLLGYTPLESVPNRTDQRMDFEGQRVVVEVKGKGKSAGEDDVMQLEKWVGEELAMNEDELPDGRILVVNGWRNNPLSDRKSVFPDNAVKTATSRDHCLISGVQLLGVVNAVLEDPTLAGRYGQKLIEHVGVFDEFDDWGS